MSAVTLRTEPGVRPYLSQIVHRAQHLRPDQICLQCGGRTVTNGQFAERVARLAGGLAALGVGRDDRVAVVAANSDRYIETMFATIWVGASFAPVNARWTAPEIALALNDCGAQTLFVDDAAMSMLDDIGQLVPNLRSIVAMGSGPGHADCVGYEQLIAEHDPIADVEAGGDDVALILYTGGTTGRPKGVLLSHANVYTAAVGMLAAGCGTGETYLHAPPLFHIAGIQQMLAHFLGGRGAHIIIEKFSAESIVAAIEQYNVTDVMLVPTMLHMVLDFVRRTERTEALRTLERIFYGAAPMPPLLLNAAAAVIPAVGFVQGYGMTESALTIMLPPWYYTHEGRKRDKVRSVGRAMPQVDVIIRDDVGRPVPRRETGEVTVKSPSVMLGYLGQPELTALAVRDGWLYTGDAGYMDEDGFVYLVGRLKDMIITGGENVYAAEVEDVLTTHPAVAMAAVIGIPSEVWGEQVHAVVALKSDTSVRADELIAYCKERLAGYKCPRSINLRGSLPVTAAGKIMKPQLRREEAENADRLEHT